MLNKAMKTLLVFLASMAAAALIPSSVLAHPRERLTTAIPRHRAMAISDEAPRVRIRGDVNNRGLDPRAFARWISWHPAVAAPSAAPPSMRILAKAGPGEHPLNAFAMADRDANGRVSADELADYLARHAVSTRNGEI